MTQIILGIAGTVIDICHKTYFMGNQLEPYKEINVFEASTATHNRQHSITIFYRVNNNLPTDHFAVIVAVAH